MVHLWWGEYLRWQSTSDDVHTPADQPWKLWHLFKLLFVLRPLKYWNITIVTFCCCFLVFVFFFLYSESSTISPNFSLFFVLCNITIVIITSCHFCITVITWVIVLTKSKDFKWFRRSPLLHNSCIKVVFKTISRIVIDVIIIPTNLWPVYDASIDLDEVEWWLFDAYTKHFYQVRVVQGFHHLLIRQFNLRG